MQLSCPSLRRRASWGKCNLQAMATDVRVSSRGWGGTRSPTRPQQARLKEGRQHLPCPQPNAILSRWLGRLWLAAQAQPFTPAGGWEDRCLLAPSLRKRLLNTGQALGGP